MKKECFVAVKGLLVSGIFSGMLVFLLALIMWKAEMEGSLVSIGVLAIYGISSMAGGFYSGKKHVGRKYLYGMLQGAVYYLGLLILALTLHAGKGMSLSQMLTIAAICLGSGMLGGMFS